VFAAVTRAVDQGLTLDPGKIGALVATALEGGDLRIARADGALTLASGQMRLSNVIANGQGADLTITGSLDLAEGVLDARLVLSGPAERDAAGLARPDVFIALKGPAASARRTIDVSALGGWLMLRAVDRETKRIEKIEAERRESALGSIPQPPAIEAPVVAPAAPAPSTIVPASPSAVVPPATAPAPPAAAPAPPAAALAPPAAAPAPPAAAPAPPAAAPAPPGTAVQPPHAPVPRPERRARPEPGEQAPALPPPIDIRPIPTPGTPRAPRAGSPSAGTRPPMPIPEPPRRSFLDSLIGPQR
jgi:large subunit ribosomal protein L24